MRIQNSKSWVKYSFSEAVQGSLLLLLSAFVVRYALHPLIEPYAPFHFFIVACLVIAYRYGYLIAIVSTLISALLGSYFFVKPYFTYGPASVSDVIQFLNFSFVTVIAILIIEKLQRTIYGREMVLKIMGSRHKISLYRENDRIYFAKSNNEAWAMLDEILTNFDDLILIQYGSAAVKLEPLFMALTLCQQPVLTVDEWQALLHPEDLAVLLAKLNQPIIKSGEVSEFSIRFIQNNSSVPYAVAIESFVFLGKPLRILRLANCE
jgi:Domain of unknown function (DUF4118)